MTNHQNGQPVHRPPPERRSPRSSGVALSLDDRRGYCSLANSDFVGNGPTMELDGEDEPFDDKNRPAFQRASGYGSS
jgi:hypothetical protein